MSDEPIYCEKCGAEECECDFGAEGPYCMACGVVPAPGRECKFYKTGGNETGCEA